MKPFKIKYGKIVEKAYLPSSWNDVSFKTYIEYFKQLTEGSIEGVYSALTGISKEMWQMPHKVELYAAIDYQLRFTKLNPSCEMPTHIDVQDGPLRKIEKDFMQLPLGLYQDMLIMIQQIAGNEEDDSKQLEVMPKIISMFVLKEYKDIEEIERTAKKIEQMPADVVYTLGCFFLSKLEKLNSGTQKSLGLLDLVKTKSKQVLTRLIAVLVIFSACIIRPKVILQTLKRYLRSLWVKFTGGSIYRIVSTEHKRSIKRY